MAGRTKDHVWINTGNLLGITLGVLSLLGLLLGEIYRTYRDETYQNRRAILAVAERAGRIESRVSVLEATYQHK